VRDRVAVVGVAAESVKDSFHTPYSRAFGNRQAMYGVELYGHIVSQLVRAGLAAEAPIAVIHDAAEALWILLWALLGGAAALLLRSVWQFFLVLVAGLALLALGVHGLFVLGWWFPLVPPALGWIGTAGAVSAYVLSEEKRQRAALMGIFSSYVSPELAEEIWRERDQFLDGGRPRPQRLTATVFFSDIAGFTTVSETLEPEKLLDWFYEFMEATTPLVGEHGGVIFRFLGDSIMAVFGVPVARTDEKDIARDAVNAVNCALTMQERLVGLNRRLQALGLPLIGMRIGILTGPMVAGSIGSAKRREYNVHGDTVNTAARLESFDRESFTPDYLSTPCRILIGESTQRYLGDAFHVEFNGDFPLKGKHNAINIYRVHGRKIK
jgi:adenylate cyclase